MSDATLFRFISSYRDELEFSTPADVATACPSTTRPAAPSRPTAFPSEQM